MAKLISRGDKTHHHDHAITPVSLSVMKTIVSSPTKPTPPEDELESDIMLFIEVVEIMGHKEAIGIAVLLNRAGQPRVQGAAA
jgi:hypothetical protein